MIREWLHPTAFLLFVPALCAAALYVFDVSFQKKAASAWGRTFTARKRYWVSAAAFIAGTIFLLAAIARPVGEKRPIPARTYERGLIFMVDVSRSMLAEDLKPNRLERAKLLAKDVIDTLDGQDAGLVAYSGTSVIKAPLSGDYNFLSMAIDELSVSSVSRGGSLLGDALRAIDTLSAYRDKSLDVIVFTDGEDQESYPEEAAAKLAKKGVRLFLVGLGDDRSGHPIPTTDETGTRKPLVFQDQTVLSRQDSTGLETLAKKTDGALYLNWGTGSGDLGRIYSELRKGEKTESGKKTTDWTYEEFYGTFLALAFGFFFLESVMIRRIP